MIILALIATGVFVCIALGLVVYTASKKRAELALPHCGHCGYNLTGAPSNRCPECGRLFIEAGVVTKQQRTTPSRGVIRGLVLALVGFAVLGMLGVVITGRLAARAAQAQAVAARQAAVQARMQADVAARRLAATTAPVADSRSARRNEDSP